MEAKRKYAQRHPDRVRESNRKQYQKNKASRKAYASRYRIANFERIKVRMAEYHKTYYPKNRIRLLRQTNEYGRTHPEVRRKCASNYKKRHPEKFKAQCRAANSARKARERGAGMSNPAANALIRFWMRQSSFSCHYCGNDFPTKKMHVDHKVAIARGGLHVPENLCRSCPLCNIRKRHYSQNERGYIGQMLFPLEETK